MLNRIGRFFGNNPSEGRKILGAKLAVTLVVVLLCFTRSWWLTLVPSSMPFEHRREFWKIYLNCIWIADWSTFGMVNLCRYLFGVKIEEKEKEEGTLWPPTLLGFIEAIFYPFAFLFGRESAIAGWIALKVLGGWKAWGEGFQARARVQVFLVGTATSIGCRFSPSFPHPILVSFPPPLSARHCLNCFLHG